MKTERYDLVIVGAGSGGYAAARTARELGATVALVDPGPLGGLCILRGCMPSKTLIATSDLAQDIREAEVLGVHAGDPRIDLSAVMARKREVIQGFTDYRVEALKSFPIYEGSARFESPTRLLVNDGLALEATSFVVGTGSVIAPPALKGLADVGYLDSDAVLDLELLPKSAIVLGGGYVACELGQFLSRVGVKTTMLIRAKHLLSGEDQDVGEALTLYFRNEGIPVETGSLLSHVERRGKNKVVHVIRDGAPREFEAEDIFYALGRVPNVEGLNLEAAGVRYHPITGIEIGSDIRTSARNIFAVGDVTGEFALVHVAIYQGEIAARNAINGTHERADYSLQRTHTIFTDPQIAIVGASEKELRRKNVPYVSGAYLFSDHGKAVSINKTKGFVKMLASPEDGSILGGAIVGAHASDLIHELIVAMYYRANVYDFVRIPHLHPTMAEILTYPAEDIVSQLERGTPAVAAAAV
ncbi:MAG: dihydrolipoyl dehydrogenase [Candidatus Eremiobacteraeota bacterium]|nr:dihydrolipoyl dehydrogenase [Candidatus Eremiobacteraeota bacterium]